MLWTIIQYALYPILFLAGAIVGSHVKDEGEDCWPCPMSGGYRPSVSKAFDDRRPPRGGSSGRR